MVPDARIRLFTRVLTAEGEMHSDEMRRKFIRFRACGYSYKQIAEELGVAYDTVFRWSKLYKDQIHNLRELEMDSLREYCFVAKIKRIQVLGDIVQTLRRNLENKKKLANLSPKENLEFLAKYTSLLREEDDEAEPEFIDVPEDLPKDIDDGLAGNAAA